MPSDAHTVSDAHEHRHGTGHTHHLPYSALEGGRYNGKAVAAIVLGLVGFVLPVIPSIFAIVFGRAAHRELLERPLEKGEGLALAGVVLGCAALAVAAFVLVALLVM